jgi:hypothetical protein
MKNKGQLEIPRGSFVSSTPEILLGAGLLSKSAYPFENIQEKPEVK